MDDLQLAREYAATSSAAYAAALVQRLITKTYVLESFPRIGRMVPEFGNPRIRELIESNFRTVYRIVSAERIDITRIHHTSQPLSDPG